MYISLLMFHGKVAFAMISKYNFLISKKLVCVKTFCAVFLLSIEMQHYLILSIYLPSISFKSYIHIYKLMWFS